MALARKSAVAVIGAGPYGLSVTAHLRAAGVPTRIFGNPLSFWRAMPERMALKSPWSASSLSDSRSQFTLDAFAAAHRCRREEPVPLSLFLKYAEWFKENAV